MEIPGEWECHKHVVCSRGGRSGVFEERRHRKNVSGITSISCKVHADGQCGLSDEKGNGLVGLVYTEGSFSKGGGRGAVYRLVGVQNLSVELEKNGVTLVLDVIGEIFCVELQFCTEKKSIHLFSAHSK